MQTFPLLCFIKVDPNRLKSRLKVIRDQSITDQIFQYLFVIFLFFLKMVVPCSLLSFGIPVPCALTYAQEAFLKSSGRANIERKGAQETVSPLIPPGAFFFFFSPFLSFLKFWPCCTVFAGYFSSRPRGLNAGHSSQTANPNH